MRIYITSDTHNQLPSSWKGFKDDGTFDYIFHCGDITNYGYNTTDYKEYSVINKLSDLKTPIIYVPGNHDCGWRNRDIFSPNKGKNVLNKLIQLEDYSVYGFSLSPCYYRPDLYIQWDNTVIDEEVERNYYLQAPKAEIILSHCPPKNCGSMDITSDGDSIGSQYLYEYILEHSPKYVFCGHVHKNSVQYYNLCGTNIYNVATNYLDINL
jgi:Icc-related predicted phosphoesterase